MTINLFGKTGTWQGNMELFNKTDVEKINQNTYRCFGVDRRRVKN